MRINNKINHNNQIQSLRAELDLVKRQKLILEEAVTDLYKHGTRHDLNPTKTYIHPDTALTKEELYSRYIKNETWWTEYIGRADRSVRSIAKRALTEIGSKTLLKISKP